MGDFWKALTALMKVKTIVTLLIVIIFCVLALRGEVTAENVMTVVTVVISFYFGIQSAKDKD